MKKILLILVGGTICTALNEKGTLSVHAQAGTVLTEGFNASGSPYANQVEFTKTENLCVLSENMTVDTWNKIIDVYRNYRKQDIFDGVIFAHGTDTLAYSAALFSLLLSDTDIPVFFVSSNARLSSNRANGHDNFRVAVECIAAGIAANVYVPYRNISDGKMLLHVASRLTQCRNYSEDFESFGAIDITGMNDENRERCLEMVKKQYPPEKRKKAVSIETMPCLKDCVWMITPYVGLRYDVIDFGKFSAVLHGAYHSGTACAEAQNAVNTLPYLLDACRRTQTAVYFSPSKTEGEIYDTVHVIASHETDSPVRFLYGYTTELAYAKLLLAYSLIDSEERSAFLQTEYHFEKIDGE